MTLNELHVLVNKVLEERPLLADKQVRYVTSTISYCIDGMVLAESGDLTLRSDDFIAKDKIWLP